MIKAVLIFWSLAIVMIVFIASLLWVPLLIIRYFNESIIGMIIAIAYLITILPIWAYLFLDDNGCLGKWYEKYFSKGVY